MYVVVLHSKYVCDSVTLFSTESFFYKWYSSSQIMNYGQIIPSSLQIPLAINFHPRRGMGGEGVGGRFFFFFFFWSGGRELKGPRTLTFKKNAAVLVSINMHKAYYINLQQQYYQCHLNGSSAFLHRSYLDFPFHL